MSRREQYTRSHAATAMLMKKTNHCLMLVLTGRGGQTTPRGFFADPPAKVQLASPGYSPGQGCSYTFINESGFYSLVLSSKLEPAKKFKRWVTSTVLPSIRQYGQYKLFDSPHNHMIMIGNETDLHYKVVDLIRRFYPDSIIVAGLGENQDTEDKRLDSYKKGYMRGQPNLMVLDYHKDFKGLCIEFKSPTNIYRVSEAQKEMKRRYVYNGYAFILSNDYDKISKPMHEYMRGIRVPCKYCVKKFLTKETLKTHYRVVHKIVQTMYIWTNRLMTVCMYCKEYTLCQKILDGVLFCDICMSKITSIKCVVIINRIGK